MSFTTLVFLLLVGFFLWRGYRKGFIDSLAQILSLMVAYPAAILLTTPLANFIFNNSSFSGMPVYFFAGSAIFLTVSFSVSKLSKMFYRKLPESPKREKSGGAFIGALVGILVGLVAVYTIDLVKKPVLTALNKQQTPTPPKALASEKTFIESSAKKFVSLAASTAVQFTLKDNTATQVTKTFAEDPQVMLGHVQALASNDNLKALMSNEEIQALLKQGDTQALLQNWEFQRMMNNENMQALLVNSEDTQGGKFSQEVAAEKMLEAWRHTDAIKNDPRVVAILEDAEFQEQLNSTNKLPLMMNPKLKQLTDIIFSGEHASQYQQENNLPTTNERAIERKTGESEATGEEPQRKIYRWVDSNGYVHYSDQPIRK
ncbi:MAG TPA: CvpA family protein [Cellvibrio sp.]|nr:CvpA family protein [Cellvibrio sp.]